MRSATTLVVALTFLFGSGFIGLNDTKKGRGGTEVSGSAGKAGVQGASDDLQTCATPIGTAALLELETTYY